MPNNPAIQRFDMLVQKSSQIHRNSGAMIGMPLQDAKELLVEITKLEGAAATLAAEIDRLTQQAKTVDQDQRTTSIDGGTLR